MSVVDWIKAHKTESFLIAGAGIAGIIIIKNKLGGSAPAANTSNATIGTNTGSGSGGSTAPASPSATATSGGGGAGSGLQSGLAALQQDVTDLTTAVGKLAAAGKVKPSTTTNNTYNVTLTNPSTTGSNVGSTGTGSKGATMASPAPYTPPVLPSFEQQAAAVNSNAQQYTAMQHAASLSGASVSTLEAQLTGNPTPSGLSYTPAKAFNPALARGGKYSYKGPGGQMIPYVPGVSNLARGTQLFTSNA